MPLSNPSLCVCFFFFRHPICAEAGVTSPHHLLAGPVPLLHGSQLSRQATLGGCSGVCGGWQPWISRQSGFRCCEYCACMFFLNLVLVGLDWVQNFRCVENTSSFMISIFKSDFFLRVAALFAVKKQNKTRKGGNIYFVR